MGTLLMVMTHEEINLQSSCTVLMLNKPCQEMALHTLSNTAGAGQAPLQPAGLHSSTKSKHLWNPYYAPTGLIDSILNPPNDDLMREAASKHSCISPTYKHVLIVYFNWIWCHYLSARLHSAWVTGACCGLDGGGMGGRNHSVRTKIKKDQPSCSAVGTRLEAGAAAGRGWTS